MSLLKLLPDFILLLGGKVGLGEGLLEIRFVFGNPLDGGSHIHKQIRIIDSRHLQDFSTLELETTGHFGAHFQGNRHLFQKRHLRGKLQRRAPHLS